MTTNPTLEALAERLEAATGPDRELDAAIARALNWCPSSLTEAAVATWAKHPEAKPNYWFSAAFGMPYFTASLDAAMALLPKHTLWSVADMEDGPICRLVVAQPGGGYTGGYLETTAATPALALCAAALRAMKGEDDEDRR